MCIQGFSPANLLLNRSIYLWAPFPILFLFFSRRTCNHHRILALPDHWLQLTCVADPNARPTPLEPKSAAEAPSSMQVSKLTFAPDRERHVSSQLTSNISISRCISYHIDSCPTIRSAHRAGSHQQGKGC